MSIFRKQVNPPENTNAERSPVASKNWWKIGGITTAGVLGVGAIGFWGLSTWVAKNLSPTIAKELSKSLDRDVQLGQLQNIGLNEINFGASSLAPNPGSASKVAIKGINIRFDPLAVLWQRKLKPDITILEPDLYLEQDAQGNWFKIPPQAPEKPGLIKTEIQGVHIRKARGTVVPFATKQPIKFQDTDLSSNFQSKDGQIQVVNFDGTSQINSQINSVDSPKNSQNSKISIKGSSSIASQSTHLEINGQGLNIAQARGIVPPIPAMDFQSGLVDGIVSVDLQPQQAPLVRGTVQVQQANFRIDQVPQPFQQASGTVRILPQGVQLQNVTTLYGQLPGKIAGNIDFQRGYDLQAQIDPVPVGLAAQAIQVQSPVPLAGQVVANLALKGKLDQPLLSGRVQTTGTAQVDRLQFKQVTSDFVVKDGKCLLSGLTALPTLGGALAGNGEITLTKQPQLRFNIRGQQLPANVLAKTYGQSLPIALGSTSLTGQVTGTTDRLTTNLQIQAPQAAYPGSANLQISPQGNIQIQQARLKVAGQEIVGVGNIDRERWQLNVQVPQIDSQALAALAPATNGQVFKLPSFLAGQVSGQMKIGGLTTGNNNNWQGQGQLQLQTKAGQIQATNFRLGKGQWQGDIQTNELLLAKVDPKLPGKLSGKFRVNGDLNQTNPATVQAIGRGAIVLGQGKITGQNLKLSQGKWQGDFSSDRFDMRKVTPQLKGQLSGRFNLNGDIQKLTPNAMQGQGNGVLRLPVGQVVAQNIQLRNGQWQGDFSPENLEVSQFNPAVRGRLSGKFNLAGDLQKMNAANLQATGSAKLQNKDGGQLTAQQFQLQGGRWQSDLSLTALRLSSFDPDLPKAWSAATVTGNFQAGGRIDKFNPASLNLAGDGRLNLGQGVMTAQGLKISDGKWSGSLGFKAIDLQQLALGLPRNMLPPGQIDGQFQLAGSLQKPSVETAQGQARLRLSTGEIVASNLQLTGDQWHGEFQTKGVSLAQLPLLSLPTGWQDARLTSNFEISGNGENFDPKQLTGSGSGQLELATGRVQIAEGLITNGVWEGQFTAEQLDLPTLAKLLPNKKLGSAQIQAGRLNATGQIAGNLDSFDPANLKLDSQISLTGLRLANLQVEPNLIGRIQNIPGEDLNLLLAGQRDRLELNWGAKNQSLRFAARLAEAVAQGQMVGPDLQVTTKNIPVGLLVSFLPRMSQLDNYRLGGLIAGQMNVNLASGAVMGKNIVVNQPRIGNVAGDRLQSNSLKYANGLLEVDGAEFRRGSNQYLLTARAVTTSKEPEYQVTVQVPRGQLADVSNLFQIFSISDLLNPFGTRDYGQASDLKPQTAGTELTTLQERIDRLSEVKRLQVAQAEQQQDNPLPDLRKLAGDFTGTIAISNAPKSGSYASFNIQGDQWTVDQYQLAKVNMQGKWQNGVLNLAALDLQSTDAQVQVQGDFGFDQQTAQIEVKKFPIERLSAVFQLPVEIAGDINMKAQLSGSWFDPQLSGTASIVDGQFSQSAIPIINTDFAYAKSRLQFNSNGLMANSSATPGNKMNNSVSSSNGESPIMISGSIPYQLPFVPAAPASNEVAINLKLQDQGMKMLDVLTQQKAIWKGGKGQVNLAARGKLNQQNLVWNSANGSATVQDGVVKFIALADNVTALNSNVVFDFDRVQVDGLTGKYGNTPINAIGTIPINKELAFAKKATCLNKSSKAATSPAEQPLAVSFNDLQVNLKDKYEGGVSGCVVLGNGSITKPTIGGNIHLAKGKVNLPGQGSDDSPDTDTSTATTNTSTSNENNPLQFNDLQVFLDQDVTLEQFGLLKLQANGSLTVNGTADRPIPTGQLNLPRGQFNLFTNRFRLTGDKNVARFDGSTDANVNLNLSTKVLETSRLPVTVGNERREVSDTLSTSLGQVQSVQIEATIKELPISKLRLDDAEFLRSKPPRSKDEILLLLSNGLGKITAGEEAVGNGLLSLAGTTLLSSFGDLQDSVGDLLGLSDFRLYPSFSQSKSSTTSTLGLAGEVGVNLGDQLSVSFFQILTGADLPQYSVRYQIDNQLLLRGSSNFDGDSRVLLELEKRF